MPWYNQDIFDDPDQWFDTPEYDPMLPNTGGEPSGGGGAPQPPGPETPSGPSGPSDPSTPSTGSGSRDWLTGPYQPEWGSLPEFNFQQPGSFDFTNRQVPPPPPPPQAPPPPASFTQTIQGVQGGTYTPPSGPGEAPDYLAILDDYLERYGGGEFQRPELPGEAPDFGAIADGIPEYQTPDNAFLGEGLFGDLEQYARDWMGNPNRYASDLAEATRSEGDLRRQQERDNRQREIEEWSASRGLTASSLEGELMVQLMDAMQLAQSQEELQLLQMLADAEIQDRQAAGLFGTAVADMGRRLGETRISEAQAANQLAMQRADRQLTAAQMQEASEMGRAQFNLDIENAAVVNGVRQAGLALQAAEMQQQSEQFRAQFEQQVAQFGFEAGYRNAQLEQQRHIRQAELNMQAAIAGDQAAMDRVRIEVDIMRAQDAAILSREQLAQQDQQMQMRSWEIQGQWDMAGQQLDMEQSRWMAEMEERRERFAADEAYRWARLRGDLDMHDDRIDSQWS